MSDLSEFVRLSKFAGERFDLVQAGGGNSSVQLDDNTFCIKASGCLLSEVEESAGYARLNSGAVKAILEDEFVLNAEKIEERILLSETKLKNVTDPNGPKPSIETFLHVLFDKFTLHVHPISVNALVSTSAWEREIENLFPSALRIKYHTPGIELGLAIKTGIKLYKSENGGVSPKITFLQNHGIIVTADNVESVINSIDQIVQKIESHFKFDLSHYRTTNKVSALLKKFTSKPFIAYLSEDKIINKILPNLNKKDWSRPFCPDVLVYCGWEPVILTGYEDRIGVEKYKTKYGETPKVVIVDNKIFFVADNVRKAMEIEAVFRSNILTLNISNESLNSLTEQELKFLSKWDAEKYRQRK